MSQTNEPSGADPFGGPLDRTFDLKAVSWKLIYGGTTYGGGRSDFTDLDDIQIEVVCQAERHWQHSKVTVDGLAMDTLQFDLELRPAEVSFAKLDTIPDGRNLPARQGSLSYFEAIPSSHTPDFKAKPASVYGCVYLGTTTIRDIANILTLRPQQEVRIYPTVAAMREPTEGAMTYDYTQGWPNGSFAYHWDGKRSLHITAVTVVTTSAPAADTTDAEDDGDEPPFEITSMSVFWLNLYSLATAVIVYFAAMDIYPTGAAITWGAGAIGTLKWPAGALGAGSLTAGWLAGITFLLSRKSIVVFYLLLRVVGDTRAIRTNLIAWLNRQKRRQ